MCYIDGKMEQPNNSREAPLQVTTENKSVVEVVVEVEEWRSLSHIGFSNYEASSLGYIRNGKTLYKIIGFRANGGYTRVGITNDNGDSKRVLMHFLIASAFHPNPDNKPTVDHINRNINDNRASNLRWATRSEQCLNKVFKRKGKPVYQLDLNGTIIQRWESLTEAANHFGIHNINITRACQNPNYTSAGYKWRYCEDNFPYEGEEWRDVPYPEYKSLKASSFGRIMHQSGEINSGNILGEYLVISTNELSTNRKVSLRVNRLVAAAFHGRDDSRQVNHKDGNKINNRPENLEYMTNQENTQHAILTGLRTYTGSNSGYKRCIRQLDLQGNLIKEYQSMTQASKELGINLSTIANVCRNRGGQLSAGGFKWEYCPINQ